MVIIYTYFLTVIINHFLLWIESHNKFYKKILQEMYWSLHKIRAVNLE